MKHNKEAQLSVLLAPVHLPDADKGQGKGEGGDEVDQLLLYRALAKLDRPEDTIGGHQGEMDEKKETKDCHICSDFSGHFV